MIRRMPAEGKIYMKNRVVILPLCLAAAALFCGCSVNISFGTDNLVGEEYPDAASYKTGAFAYNAADISAVEVYWRSGEVNITESPGAELNVRESGGEAAGDTAMHYLIDGDVLRIRFCASGAHIRVSPEDKRLHLEVPKGVRISVHATSADIRSGDLNPEGLLVSVHSGSVNLGAVTASEVELGSSSGSLRAESVSAKSLKCAASSGSVTLCSVSAGALDCITSSGCADIRNICAETVSVKSSSGGVSLDFAAAAEASVATTSGNVTLALPQGGADVVYTSNSGRLHTSRSHERSGDIYVFGGGEGRINVVTSSGDLGIK